MPRTVTQAILDDYVGKGVDNFCANGFTTAAQNHCAHFVSHALELQHGVLCGDMKYDTRHTGASMRCNELYNALTQRGAWADAPGIQDGLLLFVTLTSNVSGDTMGSAPKKHVGIVFGGKVYNFGNTAHVVRCEATVDAFKTRMGHAYGGMDKVSFFYAVPQ
ncbi:hypothetical protein [Sphingomonas sp.]|uniref:hypothetical protein n=1 Tax=Sphingomonas sp. TaxID=28214 RepID=UPI003B0077C5